MDEEYYRNLDKIFRTLEFADMKVQLDKCEFQKGEVEFLGFIVCDKGIKTNCKKSKSPWNSR